MSTQGLHFPHVQNAAEVPNLPCRTLRARLALQTGSTCSWLASWTVAHTFVDAQGIGSGRCVTLLNLRHEVITQVRLSVHQAIDGGSQWTLKPFAACLTLQARSSWGNIDGPLSATTITLGKGADAKRGCSCRTHRAAGLTNGVLIEADSTSGALPAADRVLKLSFGAWGA